MPIPLAGVNAKLDGYLGLSMDSIRQSTEAEIAVLVSVLRALYVHRTRHQIKGSKDHYPRVRQDLGCE